MLQEADLMFSEMTLMLSVVRLSILDAYASMLKNKAVIDILLRIDSF